MSEQILDKLIRNTHVDAGNGKWNKPSFCPWRETFQICERYNKIKEKFTVNDPCLICEREAVDSLVNGDSIVILLNENVASAGSHIKSA